MASRRLLLQVLLFASLVFFSEMKKDKKAKVDPRGYVVYCPCMGRFGNQAEHFLGALAFAHGLNRTLILPPWVEYNRGHTAVNVPFDDYFSVANLLVYHRVITMEKFMEEIAPDLWPPQNRISICYTARHGKKEDDCNAKEGSPFGPFWDGFNIDFVSSAFSKNLGFNTESESVAEKWNERFPQEEYPVLSFTGAPAAFPVEERNAKLQQYVSWSDHMDQQARQYIKENMPEGAALGIHLRIGRDWYKACEHVEVGSDRQMFSSANCLGYRLQFGKLTKELCYPPDSTILDQVRRFATETKVKYLYVACDDKRLLPELKEEMKKIKVSVLTQKFDNPHLDLAILGRTDYFIGNCISTFSAFAVRERRNYHRQVAFWAFQKKRRDEL